MKKVGILSLFLFLYCIPLLYGQSSVTVTSSSDDSSPGTLRWAILTTNADPALNEIVFDVGFQGSILLTANLPAVTKNLTITGPGIANLTLSGEELYTMFAPGNGIVLNISGITFTKNASANNSGSIFYATRATINATAIHVTGNNRTYAFYSKEGNSSISISNSTFSGNGGYLFGSDHGSTPSITSDVESDYSNRITIAGSTFSSNTGVIFSTERYVKIDNCVFENNTSQIGSFRGVNRYQVLNSTFTGNTGYLLFYFSSWIGQNPSFGEATLGTNNTLFDGNTFNDNTGIIINPGGSAAYDNKTTITNNIFQNNGTNWLGSPIVISGNTLDNFITSISHTSSDNTILVTMNQPVFSTDTGTGDLEASDFIFSLDGGNATLNSALPTSISTAGNVITLGIDLLGTIHGNEVLTVTFATDAVYDRSGNVGAPIQKNNTASLNFLDNDTDGVPNYLDECPTTPVGEVVEINGCTDITAPLSPVGLQVIVGTYSLTLEWDQNGNDTAGYFIYGGSDQEALVLISTINSGSITSYKHSNLNTGSSYYYYISAFDLADNESATSVVVSGIPRQPFIWDGTKTTIEIPGGSDWNLPENQEYLTDNVILAVGDYDLLFNIVQESNFDFMDYASPKDTEWALGTTADFVALTFSTWANTMQWCPACWLNTDFVVHLIEDDIYIDITLLSWSSLTGYSYERSTASPDQDNDRIKDSLDQCPNTPTGETVDANGCSDSQKDDDGDGINNVLDQCPNTPLGETVDANGCSDSQKDSDGDGVNDALDQCPNTISGETVDTNGCSESQKDADNDGVNNVLDLCPNTPSGETADTTGCSDSQKDTDSDGVNDVLDQCPSTPTGETVDANGCSESQKDDDSDSINNALDLCPNTPIGETVDATGCSDSQKDTDSDRVNDALDQCPNTTLETEVDANGCPVPSDPDTDGDGVIDTLDQCPDTPADTLVDASGCSAEQLDSDGDGVANVEDNCPQNANPDQEDRDGDGLGDVCDTVELNVSQAFTPDGDGINDTWVIFNIENYPNSVVRVFNAWGKEVFSVRNYRNDWDGGYKDFSNKLPDSGSYYYQIDFDGDGSVDQDGWLYITSR